MKIYTKKGDEGQTSLVDGTRVSKSEIRIHCYGTVDELNSHLGILTSLLENEETFSIELQDLKKIQGLLFQLGSQLACASPEMAAKLPTISSSDITPLETLMDQWEKELPELKNFILPGGHLASSQAQVCRTLCRRAERNCVLLNDSQKLNFPAIAFLNRLSDYFFVLARVINHRMAIASPEWKP